MSSDRARISYDATRQYRAVIAQQGRVTLEADVNEEQTIANEETRAEALDFVGPSGTPDDGYRVIETGKPAALPFDFTVQHGTMYVGGLRVTLPADVDYATQGEWIDHTGDPVWVPPTAPADPKLPNELIYLLLREQEVSAVEDSALREVALGGPDTAQRLRIVQRIVRRGVAAGDCPGAWAEARRLWAAQGLTFDDATMRLTSDARLRVSFSADPGPPNLCEPDARGGYLGAENQLVRVQIAVDPQTNAPRLLWGYDNASFLYPVQVDATGQTLTLGRLPVDDYHKPTVGQAVEVLRAAVRLTDTAYIASATGIVATLAEAYDPDTHTITLPAPLPAEYRDANETPALFLRVWQEWQPADAFTPGRAIDLTETGIQVTLETPNGEPFHHGDFWAFAVRPSTPQQVYPQRYLDDFQPVEGSRLWACPLAVIAWEPVPLREDRRRENILRVREDCRNPFDNLVELTKRGGGCCDIVIRPENVDGGAGLQGVIDRFRGRPAGERATICLMPGVYALREPLYLDRQHAGLTLEACHAGVILRAAPGTEQNFLQGLVVLNRANEVSFRGLQFVLPETPVAQTGAKPANLALRRANDSITAAFRNLWVSVGLRPLHCAQLTVTDCLFRYPLTAAAQAGGSAFGVGIFAASECWGITLERNRFLHEEALAYQFGEPPFRLLIGYLLTPTVQFRPAEQGTRASATRGGSALVRSLLDDAVLRDNRFSGITVAGIVVADTGHVRIAENTVQECYGGFWLFSLRTQLAPSSFTHLAVRAEIIDRARQLQSALLSIALDPALVLALTIAYSFPLDDRFDASHAIAVTPQTLAASEAWSRAAVDRFFNQALALPIDAANAANAKEQVDARTTAAIVEQYLGTSRQWRTLSDAFTRLAGVGRVVLEGQPARALTLMLQMAENVIDTRLEKSPSGAALIVWDSEQDTGSHAVLSANSLRSVLPRGKTSGATAAIEMVDCCTVTGNVLLNEAGDGFCLHVRTRLPQSVTATGNIFRFFADLPARNFPAPLDTWEPFNSHA